eukprot:gene2813-5532_t
MLSQSFKDKISEDISETTKVKFKGSDWNTGYGGGGGADVGVLKDGNTGQEYFCKIGGIGSYDMLSAEYNGVKDMFETATIRVPRPICCGCIEYNSYVVFEKISLGGSGSAEIMGEKLAAMHKCTSSDGMFGWKMNNTIGATFQPNKKMKDWAEFWDSQRLGHMLTLCKREGASFPQESLLRQKVKSLLESHHCIPSLVHGDLWSGNKAYTKEGDPVIFDPATYYGDREVDIAMTYLFGTFDKKFYESYNKTWPLPVGHEKRRVVYNLYHILNHYVLFGGGYLNEANSMIASILKF